MGRDRWGGTERDGIAIILETPAVTALLLYKESRSVAKRWHILVDYLHTLFFQHN